MLRLRAAGAGGADARACPCRRPRTSRPRCACGRRPACRSVRLPSAPRRPAPRVPSARRSCSCSDHAPIAIRCCLSRAIGSPSGKCAQSSAGPVFGWIVRGRVRPGAVGHPFDQRRPEVAARALGRPLRCRMDREKVVAVDAQRRDAAAHAARREGGALAAGNGLERRDGPLVVDHVEDDRRAVHVGEGQRGVEIGLGGGAVADPGRRDLACRP